MGNAASLYLIHISCYFLILVHKFQFGPPPTPNFQPQPSCELPSSPETRGPILISLYRARNGLLSCTRTYSRSVSIPMKSILKSNSTLSTSYLFDHAWSRVRDHASANLGVGYHEARHWHRRAYGGIVCHPVRMSAPELTPLRANLLTCCSLKSATPPPMKPTAPGSTIPRYMSH